MIKLAKDKPHAVSIDEWHLCNTGEFDGKVGADCNVLPAWELCRGDVNITVAVIDGGFDLSHPGLSSPGKFRDSYDAVNDQLNPSHDSMLGAHGTACAELAVGSGDAGTVQGTAPACTWMPIRINGRLGEPQELRAFQHALEYGADIISCSWGALDQLRNEPWPISSKLRNIIRQCVNEGRGGKGIPVFFAAGNGNELVDLDGYANNPDVICVSAITNQNEKASYSDYGRNVWIAAPSSGGTQPVRITLRERFLATHFTRCDFGSTSASVAIAGGIAGLMLSANPELEAAAIRDILRRTAVKTNYDRPPVRFTDYWGAEYTDRYDEHGHSLVYGWGRIDAHAAVQEALRQRAKRF